MLAALVAVGVGLLVLGLNTYWVLQNQWKANVVAQEAARALAPDIYWLDCVRRLDFKIEAAQTKAQTLAAALANEMGLAPPNQTVVTEIPAANGIGSVLRVNVKFSPFRLPFQLGGAFPAVFQVSGIGVSSATITRPYLEMHYNAPMVDATGSTTRVTAVVPAFGFVLNQSGHGSGSYNVNMPGMPPFAGTSQSSRAMVGYSGNSDERAHPGYYNPN